MGNTNTRDSITTATLRCDMSFSICCEDAGVFKRSKAEGEPNNTCIEVHTFAAPPVTWRWILVCEEAVGQRLDFAV
ncbi:hypothetical protein KC354_g20 [Hortaea werneckii]|nr:hypothetical protein KC354_g20 [Hortaea werneckii]